jgi:hypothetical protein
VIEAARGLALLAAFLVVPTSAQAGPPFETDDPEPVKYGHWEVYLATQHQLTRIGAAGTAPHLEVNLGALPDLQVHLVAPLSYARPSGGPLTYGPGDIELGLKLRLLKDDGALPMVGLFPLFELPVGSASRGLGTGRLHFFLPLWLQKSFGDWTTYCGGGYWLNPGTGARNYWFVGWQAQRRLGQVVTLGAEVYYTTPDRADAGANLRFNLGLVLDFTDHHHLLFSAGRSIVGDTLLQGYLAYQLTL